MKRVLHVCETVKGGIATYLRTFDSVCGGDLQSKFVVPDDQIDQLPDGFNVIGFRRSSPRARAVLSLSRVALRVAQRFSPEIIIFHSTFSLGAMSVLRLNRVPAHLVYCPHGWARLRYTEEPLKAWVASKIEGNACGLADIVLNISKNDKYLAERHGYLGKHILVENALSDVPRSRSPTPFRGQFEQINLLFVGRFDRQKGLDILLEAFPRARALNPKLHLHVVGASVLERKSADVRRIPGVTFHSWMPAHEISKFYENADLLVMPSRWEGLPMVLIEALRAGTPAMVPDTSGLGELIGTDGAGIVVPPSTEGFFEALTALEVETLSARRPLARRLYEKRYGPERFKHETLGALMCG